MQLNEATLIALWGAVLSTILAAIKVWEIWRDRFQIDVSYNFKDADHGNEILIRNLSSRPIILEYWELYYTSGRWPNKKLELVKMADPDTGDVRVDPHTTHILHFTEENYFSWSHKILKGRCIQLQLHVAGRKPIFKRVYPQ